MLGRVSFYVLSRLMWCLVLFCFPFRIFSCTASQCVTCHVAFRVNWGSVYCGVPCCGVSRAVLCPVLCGAHCDVVSRVNVLSRDGSVSRVQCLRDSALPVQIEAASSLRYLIELDEAEEPVLQVLPDILNEYFRIMQEIGLDEVGHRVGRP